MENLSIDELDTILASAFRSNDAYKDNSVCTVHREGDEIAIIFRGTDSTSEWISNLSFRGMGQPGDNLLAQVKPLNTPFKLWDHPQPTLTSRFGTRLVHSDWQTSLEEECKNKIYEVLGGEELNNVTPNTHITITGHSRGGVLGTLCAAQLLLKRKLQGLSRITLVTFATPRSGNDAFYSILQKAITRRQLSFYRVEHIKDPFVKYILRPPNIGKEVILRDNFPPTFEEYLAKRGEARTLYTTVNYIIYYHKMERYVEEIRNLQTDYCVSHGMACSLGRRTDKISRDIQNRQRARANEIERTRKSTDCCAYCIRFGNMCMSGGEKFHRGQRIKLEHLIAEDRKLTQIENQQRFDATKYGVDTTRMSKETRDEVVNQQQWITIHHRHTFCSWYGTCKEMNACHPIPKNPLNMVSEYVERGFAKRDVEEVLELVEGCNTSAKEVIEEHPVFEGKREAAKQELNRRHHERLDILNKWSASFRPDTNDTGSTYQVYTALGVEVNSCLPETGLRQLAITTYDSSMWKLEETDNRLNNWKNSGVVFTQVRNLVFEFAFHGKVRSTKCSRECRFCTWITQYRLEKKLRRDAEEAQRAREESMRRAEEALRAEEERQAAEARQAQANIESNPGRLAAGIFLGMLSVGVAFALGERIVAGMDRDTDEDDDE